MNSHFAINQAVAFAKAQCLQGGSESPLLDAQLLLQSVLDCDRQYLYMHPEQRLNEAQWQAYRELVARRREGHPIAHLLGYKDFWSLTLEVNASTLIPRPDTEILVEQALLLDLPREAKVLELGCGTGAISLALATERPAWHLVGLDIEPAAVQLAIRNRDRYQLGGRVEIHCSDWFSIIPQLNYQQFDLIVSNPPYIDPVDAHLDQGDVRFEPRRALVAEAQGYADLATIISTGYNYLAPQGWMLLEHGYQQAAQVADYFVEKGYQKVNTAKDYANLDRVTFAQRG